MEIHQDISVLRHILIISLDESGWQPAINSKGPFIYNGAVNRHIF